MTVEPRDALALHALAQQYASAVDRRDRERFLAVFADGAALRIHDPAERSTPSSELIGHEQLARVTERIARYDRTFHMVGGGSYEVDGDTAAGEVMCVAHHVTRGATAEDTYDDVMYIRYLDDFRRGADGAWLIAQRRLLVDFRQRLPAT
jgi:ketosteroid isomerase-like protein